MFRKNEMKQLILLIQLFLFSCSGFSTADNQQNLACMQFMDVPSIDWFSKTKKQEYRDVIESLMQNELMLNRIKITDSKADLYEQLKQLGFKKELTFLKEKNNFKLNQMGEKIPLEIFEHEDGSVVRIKPQQDLSNRYHPYPHYVLTVKDLTCQGSFQCELVKVGRLGKVFPKHPSEFKKGTSSQELDCWGKATHIRFNQL